MCGRAVLTSVGEGRCCIPQKHTHITFKCNANPPYFVVWLSECTVAAAFLLTMTVHIRVGYKRVCNTRHYSCRTAAWCLYMGCTAVYIYWFVLFVNVHQRVSNWMTADFLIYSNFLLYYTSIYCVYEYTELDICWNWNRSPPLTYIWWSHAKYSGELSAKTTRGLELFVCSFDEGRISRALNFKLYTRNISVFIYTWNSVCMYDEHIFEFLAKVFECSAQYLK